MASATNSSFAAEDSPPPEAVPTSPAPSNDSPDVSAVESPEERAARYAIAKEHFDKARALRASNDNAAALAEFLAARRAYPTWSATSSASVCLQLLHRYDEALDMFEILLRDYEQTMPKDAKIAAQKALVEMSRLVGAVDIIDAELNAAITIDGRQRGTYPSPNPFRVPAGTHIVRVYMEGHEPFEKSVDVAGNQKLTISAPLRKLDLDLSGRLRVTEANNRELDVLIDGNTVGKTPWEGSLRDGEHTIVLQGSDEWGTQPATVFVKRGKTELLGLAAERLEAALRIKPRPAGATIAIDGIPVGRGVWQGKLRKGQHRIEIAADGFILFVKDKSLDKGADETIEVTLGRDPLSPLWKDNRGRMFVEVGLGPTIVPSFRGDILGACGESCSQWFGAGGKVALRFGFRMQGGFLGSIDVGSLVLGQKITNRATSVVPAGLAPEQGVVSDSLSLRGMLLGASFGILVGKKELPVSLRLGAGVLLGATFRDRRSGTFTTNPRMNGGATYPAQTYEVDAAQDSSVLSIYAAPDVQVHIPLKERLHLAIGIETLLLLTPESSMPQWSPNASKVDAATSGQATFLKESLMGSALLFITPGASLRYEF